jgi:hypothetical protein
MLFKANWFGTEHTFDMPLSREEFDGILRGEPFPGHLTADQREFFITGCPPGEFDKMFKNDAALEAMCDPDALLPYEGDTK